MNLTAVDELLTTTRSVRRRLDLARPVERSVIQQCLELAIQAPTGGDTARYHFVVVTDATQRAELAKLYRRGLAEIYPPRRVQQVQETKPTLMSSVTYLADHLHEVPVHIVPCIAGRDGFAALGPDLGPPTFYGSILPATWSLMLALRSRGLGSAWTTSHLKYAREAAVLLGIPDDITQAALLPVAYLAGTALHPAKRVPAKERTYWDTWGQRDRWLLRPRHGLHPPPAFVRRTSRSTRRRLRDAQPSQVNVRVRRTDVPPPGGP